MLIEFLLELKDSIDRHGIRWGVALTLFALFRKERRNHFLDKRDDAIFHNQRLIMESLGIGDQYRGQVTLSETDRQNYKRLFLSSRKAIQSVRLLKTRRVNKMGRLAEALISKKLWAFVILVVCNGLNDTLQLHLSAETIANVTTGGTAYIVVQGVVDIVLAVVKRKGAVENGTGSAAKYTGDGPAI